MIMEIFIYLKVNYSEELGGGSVIKRSDGLWVPMDDDNTDYQQYLAWLEEGNVPEEWNPEEA
jgi:hypothetical protein